MFDGCMVVWRFRSSSGSSRGLAFSLAMTHACILLISCIEVYKNSPSFVICSSDQSLDATLSIRLTGLIVTWTNSARLGRSGKIFIGSAVGLLPPVEMDASIVRPRLDTAAFTDIVFLYVCVASMTGIFLDLL